MELGMCISATKEQIIDSKKAGFDYAEMKLFELTSLDVKQIQELKTVSINEGLPVPVCNFFCPGSIRLCNPGFDKSNLIEYSMRALECAFQIGADIVVIGSKKSRNIPEDYNRVEAEKSLVDSFYLLGEIAKSYNVTIAVEPLNKMESNMINTVEDGARFCRKVNHSNVKLLADFYHMILENENLDSISNNKDIIVHTHICSVLENKGRGVPKDDDGIDYAEIRKAILNSGYSGKMTLEVFNTDITTEGSIAINTLRKYFS